MLGGAGIPSFIQLSFEHWFVRKRCVTSYTIVVLNFSKNCKYGVMQRHVYAVYKKTIKSKKTLKKVKKSVMSSQRGCVYVYLNKNVTP
jgi:hypothetical protein